MNSDFTNQSRMTDAFDPGMSQPGTPSPSGQAGSLNKDSLRPEVIEILLQMGLSAPTRPIDYLVQRLSGPGSTAWLGDALRLPQVGCKGDPEAELARGRLDIREIDEIKERCKVAALTDADTNVRLATTAGYYLAIAAAAVHHRRLISSQPRGELSAMLLDFGSVAPEPWATLLGRAALQLGAA